MTRTALKCDCCGSQTVAEVVDGKLVIRVRRHGKTHIFSERLDRLAASLEKGAIKQGVLRVADKADAKPQP